MERMILHCDLNNFYASVECLRYPELATRPLAVTGDPAKRHGIVLAKNILAKKFGVTTGEPIHRAVSKCPDLVCVPAHYEDYVRFSEQVFDIYTHYTDRVEAFGPDECWLDVTESRTLFGDGAHIADLIRERVRRETGGLTLSAGVSWNKVFAKLGSDYKKPDATTQITHANYQHIVWPLPCCDLFMIGRATAATLAKLNINTIGELASSADEPIVRKLGVNGAKILRYARGEDDEPVRLYYEKRIPQSIGHGITAARDLADYDDVRVVIYFLSDMIAKRLRKGNYYANKVSIDLRDNALTHRSHQCVLPYATDSATVLGDAAFTLARRIFIPGDDLPLRTVTISAAGLCDGREAHQYSMFEPADYEREHRLGSALDYIHERFGAGLVKRALSMGQSFVYDKTQCEDFLPFKR